MSKKAAVEVIALFLCVILSGCTPKTLVNNENNSQDQSNPNWKVVLNAQNDKQPNYVAFDNEQHGISIGNLGSIYYTNDGGKTWTAALNNSSYLYGVDIIDKDTAITTGDGIATETLDGGAHWNQITFFGKAYPDQDRYVSFIDKNTGWMANPDKLGKTDDGGKTWTEITLPQGLSTIAAISLYDANTGYVLGENGALYITTDAGKTWTTTALNLSSLNLTNVLKKQSNILYTADAPHNAMKFFNANDGMVVFSDVSNGEGKTWVATTKDGGTSWKFDQLNLGSTYKLAYVYLSNDGKYLTVTNLQDIIVLRYFGE